MVGTIGVKRSLLLAASGVATVLALTACGPTANSAVPSPAVKLGAAETTAAVALALASGLDVWSRADIGSSART